MPVVKVVLQRWQRCRAVVYMVSAEHQPIPEAWGQSPQWGPGTTVVKGQSSWSRGQGHSPHEAGGILISHGKNKTETEKINSNKSQMEKTGA